MAVFKSTFAGGKPKYGKKAGSARQLCTGTQLHDISVEIPTSAMDNAADAVLLYRFPDESDVYLLRTSVDAMYLNVDTLDSGTNLKYDIGIATAADGVADTVLINDATVGQTTSGTDKLDAVGAPLKVDGNYLVMDMVTAAATPVSGTLRLRFYASYGLTPDVDSSLV